MSDTTCNTNGTLLPFHVAVGGADKEFDWSSCGFERVEDLHQHLISQNFLKPLGAAKCFMGWATDTQTTSWGSLDSLWFDYLEFCSVSDRLPLNSKQKLTRDFCNAGGVRKTERVRRFGKRKRITRFELDSDQIQDVSGENAALIRIAA